MTPKEVYKRLSIKVNQNDTNRGVAIPKSLFVLLFNTESKNWLGNKLDTEGSTWKLEHLAEFLVSDQKLVEASKKSDAVLYTLPGDFYRHASSFALADKDTCNDIRIYTFEKKPANLNTVLLDAYQVPSFEFEEGPMILTGNTAKVFFDDFTIKDYFFSYYKNPPEIDIEGYTHFDGTPSKNVDVNMSVENIDSILDWVAAEIVRNYKDPESLQLRKEAMTGK